MQPLEGHFVEKAKSWTRIKKFVSMFVHRGTRIISNTEIRTQSKVLRWVTPECVIKANLFYSREYKEVLRVIFRLPERRECFAKKRIYKVPKSNATDK